MAKFSIRTSDIESREYLIELARTMAAITAELEPLLKSHSARVASNCANFLRRVQASAGIGYF